MEFDQSGYAALGWSVVSFGLQVAANAKGAQELVLSSSEVVAGFLRRYGEIEQRFRGKHAGDEFDRCLTNVYKAILLYVIELDDCLRQSGLGMFSQLSMPGFSILIVSRAPYACGLQG